MRLNKKIFSATVMIVVLSLALNLVSFASDDNNVVLVSTYLDGYSLSKSDAFHEINSSTLKASAPVQTTFNTGQSASAPWNAFRVQYTSSFVIPKGSRVIVDWSIGCSLSSAYPVPVFTDNQHGWTGGSCFVGSIADDGYVNLFSSATVENVSNASTGTAEYSYHGVDIHAETIADDELIASLQFYVSGVGGSYSEFKSYGWVTYTLRNYTIVTPDGQIIKAVEDGVNNITGGWSDSGMNNSNQELGGALGELDDMQQNADNDLHDALGNLESPTVDFNGNAVSFITSSVAMLWGSLGGFSTVLLCALFITVFNFISRYRGS